MQAPIAEGQLAIEAGESVDGVLVMRPAVARWDGLWAALAIGVAVLATLPFAPALGGDDISFGQTALIFSKTGHFAYNGWAAMPLGWLAVWGALFIRLFGFSAPVLYTANTILGLFVVLLLHDIFSRFGLNRRNAFLSTLLVGLSPLFLPLLNTFLSDIAGLLSILICVAMCQRAVTARSAASTAGWLVAAGLVNLADGTVRQICWMGVLVMVPATGWMLRRRRGALIAALLTTLVGALAILVMLHWFNAQPYVVPEGLIQEPLRPKLVLHFLMQWTAACLLTTAIGLPLTLAWLRSSSPRRATLLRAGAAMAVVGVLLMVVARHARQPDTLAKALFPWMAPIYLTLGFSRPTLFMGEVTTFSMAARAVISVALFGALWVLGEYAVRMFRARNKHKGKAVQARGAFWILVPYSLAYMAALSGRATFDQIQDRYLLLLLPGLVVGMVLLYQRVVGPSLPKVTSVAIVMLSVFAILGIRTSNSFAWARQRLDQRVRATGVPRNQIAEGWLLDLTVELSARGFVNRPGMTNPPNAYDAHVPTWGLPAACVGYHDFVPNLHPVYFFSGQMDEQCLAPSAISPETYTGWLPPFHRRIYVLQKKALQKKAASPAP